jgi:Bacterial PH domain
MQIKHGATTVFRHNLIAGLVVGANVILLPIVVVALARPAVGTAVGAAVVSCVLWVLWLLGWWSKVVIGPDGVTVDNVILRHVIPWEQLRDIRAAGGLTFELTDGTGVGSASYGGSLAGALTGWRGIRRVREQMLASRPVRAADSAPPHHERRSRVKIAWWPLVAYLVPLEAVSIISGLGHHKPLF